MPCGSHKPAQSCTHQSHISSPCPQPRSHPTLGVMGPQHSQEDPCPSPWCALAGGGVGVCPPGWARRAPTWLCLRPGRPPVLAHIAAPQRPCPAKPITRRLCGSPLSPAPLPPGHGAWHGPPGLGGSNLQPPPSPYQGSICPQSPWGRQPLLPQPPEPCPLNPPALHREGSWLPPAHSITPRTLPPPVPDRDGNDNSTQGGKDSAVLISEGDTGTGTEALQAQVRTRAGSCWGPECAPGPHWRQRGQGLPPSGATRGNLCW